MQYGILFLPQYLSMQWDPCTFISVTEMFIYLVVLIIAFVYSDTYLGVVPRCAIDGSLLIKFSYPQWRTLTAMFYGCRHHGIWFSSCNGSRRSEGENEDKYGTVFTSPMLNKFYWFHLELIQIQGK